MIQADHITNVLLSLVSLLIGTGVIGLFAMSRSVTRLEAQVKHWTDIFQETTVSVRDLHTRVAQVETRQEAAKNRLDRLEASEARQQSAPR